VIACFGDTSYYLALLIPQDAYHDNARSLSLELRRPVITSEFILLEIGNYLSSPPARTAFGSFLRILSADRFTTVVPASSELLSRGIALFERRVDKAWSLTDCTSFVIMEERGIVDALTADHHFEQAGFNVLLK
jgi:predicted nucleic acid-binding protein